MILRRLEILGAPEKSERLVFGFHKGVSIRR
jgi:hypothetical protein